MSYYLIEMYNIIAKFEESIKPKPSINIFLDEVGLCFVFSHYSKKLNNTYRLSQSFTKQSLEDDIENQILIDNTIEFVNKKFDEIFEESIKGE